MSWILKDDEFKVEKIELNGNKFLLSNGYMGYRGTLEEFSKEQFTGCILAGLYDQVESKWREPVNAPNGLYVKLYCNGEPLTVFDSKINEHCQILDIKNALHRRRTSFQKLNNQIIIEAERFLSAVDVHLQALKYSITVSEDCQLRIETGIDGDVWDINGTHLNSFNTTIKDNNIVLTAVTNELKKKIYLVEGIEINFGIQGIEHSNNKIIRVINLDAKAGVEYSFTKYLFIYTDNDGYADPLESAHRSVEKAFKFGYERLLEKHRAEWEKRWERADIIIEGDSEAQFALRYSIYHLLAAAPTHSKSLSIPARGLSSQVYKGAIFWDTELYMLPFFIYTYPQVARNIINYRIDSLDEARKKAREYGFRGAFYAWESQEKGQEACTHFSVNDVFTGRLLRTYFRDKQIHISADVVYGIWHYYQVTGDKSVLNEGGAEVILECARFFYSYSYYNPDSGCYEILDVTGPDEYHERVHNNAYTNMMARYTAEIALEVLDLVRAEGQGKYDRLIDKLDYHNDLKNIEDFYHNLYIPEPQTGTNLIEQFEGFFKLEDVSLKELKGRILKENEYLGGPNGLATTTQIIKQADTVLMLNQFKHLYSDEIKRNNWEYYEPRTEHGSSLSSCVYAMLAAHLGKTEWAYKYFIKTATIDLSGKYKQYVGDLFIGGIHLASNGGAWLAAIFGFAGLDFSGDNLVFKPCLPEKWVKMKFKIQYKGETVGIEIRDNRVKFVTDREEQGG
jgi:trehalose/maltose hydrolase-like predicted phosphorylase